MVDSRDIIVLGIENISLINGIKLLFVGDALKRKHVLNHKSWVNL